MQNSYGQNYLNNNSNKYKMMDNLAASFSVISSNTMKNNSENEKNNIKKINNEKANI